MFKTATFLDPRFKTKYFADEIAKKEVIDFVTSEYLAIQLASKSSIQSASQSNETTENEDTLTVYGEIMKLAQSLSLGSKLNPEFMGLSRPLNDMATCMAKPENQWAIALGFTMANIIDQELVAKQFMIEHVREEQAKEIQLNHVIQ